MHAGPDCASAGSKSWHRPKAYEANYPCCSHRLRETGPARFLAVYRDGLQPHRERHPIRPRHAPGLAETDAREDHLRAVLLVGQVLGPERDIPAVVRRADADARV